MTKQKLLNTMTDQDLFYMLLDEAETFGELPEEIEGLDRGEYLKRLTSDERDQLDDAITCHAEQTFEAHLNNFYGGSEPVTVKEMQSKAFDEKRKLR